MTRQRGHEKAPEPTIHATDTKSIQEKSPRPVPVPLADLAEQVKRSLGSMAAVLDRHGVERRGRLVRCPSPDHEDANPSASIFQGARGERIYCFSCGFSGDVIDVAAVLGERVEWPTASRPLPKKRKRRPRPMPSNVAAAFLEMEDAALSWDLAGELAKLPEQVARQHLLSSWDALSERCDIPLVLRWTRLIRGTAVLNYCTSKTVEDPRSVVYAVRRLLVGRPR